MPEGAVYVGRPTKWGNPYPLSAFNYDIDWVLRTYRRYLTETPLGCELLADAKTTLRGKDLACWCSLSQPCHADVLLEMVNGL
jgi:hypothetical protein